MPKIYIYLKNEFYFWNVHVIMNTSGLLQETRSIHDSQEIRSIHDSMNLPKIEFIAFFYILLQIFKIWKL